VNYRDALKSQNYMNGHWSSDGDGTLDVIDKYSGDTLASLGAGREGREGECFVATGCAGERPRDPQVAVGVPRP
jgi:hypothetical protein